MKTLSKSPCKYTEDLSITTTTVYDYYTKKI